MRDEGRNPRRSRPHQGDGRVGSPSDGESALVVDETDAAADGAEVRPSKTARKKEMLGYQSMAAALLDLPNRTWRDLPLSERLGEALREGQSIRSHGARRRYLRWLGALLSQEDGEILAKLKGKLTAGPGLETRQLHFAEQWRERLLEQGESALGELASRYPALDRAQLMALLRLARQEQQSGAKPLAKRRLFQRLKALYQE